MNQRTYIRKEYKAIRRLLKAYRKESKRGKADRQQLEYIKQRSEALGRLINEVEED